MKPTDWDRYYMNLNKIDPTPPEDGENFFPLVLVDAATIALLLVVIAVTVRWVLQ